METAHYSIAKYVVGFITSLALTVLAYLVVTQQVFPRSAVLVVVTLASIQVLVQLFFFLHLGEETQPRWKLGVFVFMLLVLAILVHGSLWIMQNLDYNMSSEAMDSHIIDDEGIRKY